MENKQMTVRELRAKLFEIEDQDTPVEVSTGHTDKGGRFYGGLYRVSTVKDYKGKRIRLTGELEE